MKRQRPWDRARAEPVTVTVPLGDLFDAHTAMFDRWSEKFPDGHQGAAYCECSLASELRRVEGAQRLGINKRGDGPCDDCGTLDNPIWAADHALWNLVMGGPEAQGDPGGILCISCFIRRAPPAHWRLTAVPEPSQKEEVKR